MVTGPQSMPVFNDQNITPERKRDVIAFLNTIQEEPNASGSALGQPRPGAGGAVRLDRRHRRPDRLRRLARLQGGVSDEPDDSTTDDVDAGRTDMSDNAPARTEDVPAPEHAVALAGTTAAPTLFENPGMPVHVHRMADSDPRAAKRAERQVATMFVLSMVGTLVFLVSYFAVDHRRRRAHPVHRRHAAAEPVARAAASASGCCSSASAPCTGPRRSCPTRRSSRSGTTCAAATRPATDAVAVLAEGGETSGIGRRPLIKLTLGGALGLFGLPFIVGAARPRPAARRLALDHVLGDRHAPGHRPGVRADQGLRRHDRLGLPRDARGHRQDRTTSWSSRRRPP